MVRVPSPRKLPNSDPRSSLVPDFEITFTTPPTERPLSAVQRCCSTWNSWIDS